MKVLWSGDSPTVSSGFAKCTREVCNALHSRGHEVSVLGLNMFGDPHSYPYPIYPCVQPLDHGRDGFGVTRLPYLVDRIKPDVLVFLNDPWNIRNYLEALSTAEHEVPKVVGWLAVDAKNQKGKSLNELDHVVTWTQFGIDELIKGGYEGDYSIVPLGVDTRLFYPRDKVQSRKITCPANLPENAFIVGVVGRNQIRKRLDLTIEYFAEWIHKANINDAYLYLHVAPTGDTGCDIRRLTVYHGVQGRVILCEPDIGIGYDESIMPNVYSAFDVYLTTSQGEGWGLPTHEAMACGVPCIVPNWSALGEWVGDAAIKVECKSTALTAPINSLAYTVGGIPDKRLTVNALNLLYRSAENRSRLTRVGIELSSRLTWSNTADQMSQVIESLIPVEVAA